MVCCLICVDGWMYGAEGRPAGRPYVRDRGKRELGVFGVLGGLGADGETVD